MVRLQVDTARLGTGFVVYCEEDVCLVMTAFHVVQGSQEVKVIFPGGQLRFDGSVMQFTVNAPADLALVRFACPGQSFETMVLADAVFYSRLQFSKSTVYLRGYTMTPVMENLAGLHAFLEQLRT